MLIGVWFLIVTAVVGTAVEGAHRKPPAGSQQAIDGSSLLKGNYRARRAIFTLGTLMARGLRAAKDVFKGTKRVPSRYKNMKEFEKRGSYKTAMYDFQYLNPSGVQEFKLPNQGRGMYGKFGDRVVMIQDKDIHTGKAILRMIKELPTKEHRVLQITYTN